jgi:hypothetical protein
LPWLLACIALAGCLQALPGCWASSSAGCTGSGPAGYSGSAGKKEKKCIRVTAGTQLPGRPVDQRPRRLSAPSLAGWKRKGTRKKGKKCGRLLQPALKKIRPSGQQLQPATENATSGWPAKKKGRLPGSSSRQCKKTGKKCSRLLQPALPKKNSAVWPAARAGYRKCYVRLAGKKNGLAGCRCTAGWKNWQKKGPALS